MGDAENYRRRARECRALAVATASNQHQTVWLELEQHWLRLAETLELYGRVDPFTAFILTGAPGGSKPH
jgi:hypothetical protein